MIIQLSLFHQQINQNESKYSSYSYIQYMFMVWANIHENSKTNLRTCMKFNDCAMISPKHSPGKQAHWHELLWQYITTHYTWPREPEENERLTNYKLEMWTKLQTKNKSYHPYYDSQGYWWIKLRIFKAFLWSMIDLLQQISQCRCIENISFICSNFSHTISLNLTLFLYFEGKLAIYEFWSMPLAKLIKFIRLL